MWLLIFPAFIIGALGRRIAGGVLSQWLGWDIGTQPQRVIWALSAAGTALAAGVVWWGSLAFGLSIWIGSASVGYNGSLGMGRTGQADQLAPPPAAAFWRDFGFMQVHGIGGVGLGALGAWWLGYAWWPLILAGLCCAPLYALAWLQRVNLPMLGVRYEPANGLFDPDPLAELMWGGVIGVAIVATVLV